MSVDEFHNSGKAKKLKEREGLMYSTSKSILSHIK